MNKQSLRILVLIHIIFSTTLSAQEDQKVVNAPLKADLFYEQEILPVKLNYSNKDIKKNTNDSTYLESVFTYKREDGSWENLNFEYRARGKNRLKNCYFAPIKIKIKKSVAKNTLFEGHTRLKMVLPCLLQKDKNDNILKEYLAYKLYEIISPYYFKTRLIDIEYTEAKGTKNKVHQIKGFLIEDDKRVAKRFDGKIYKRSMHPLNQDAVTSMRNAFFQFMIGNTDFSQAYQHNIKLLFLKEVMIPVPYDFDMAGFVNCTYAVVPQINDQQMNLTSVTQRKYRGFIRDAQIFQQIRKEFLDNRVKVFSLLDTCEPLFEDARELNTAKNYILSFYDILTDDKNFKSEIVDRARKL